MKIIAIIFAAFLSLPADAAAHAFSRSLSTWRLASDETGALMVNAVFSVPTIAAELVPFGDPTITAAARFSRHLSENITVRFGAALCKRESVQVRQIARSQLRAVMQFRCSQVSEDQHETLAVGLSIFFNSDPVHIHFARFLWHGKSIERLFSATTQSHQLKLGSAAQNLESTGWGAFTAYVPIGVEHILSGWDHLAFLAALLLVCARLRLIFWAITGFTLGHSLTLGLAALDILSTDSSLVEALIGFTVLLMALESTSAAPGQFRRLCLILASSLAGFFLLSLFWPSALGPLAWAGLLMFILFWGFFIRDHDHASRMAPFLSVLFGLIHGFGFASVLAEANLPQAHLLAALAGFNIGVELGQVALVVSLLVLVGGLARILPLWTHTRALWQEMPHIAASILVGLGVYWFVGRALL